MAVTKNVSKYLNFPFQYVTNVTVLALIDSTVVRFDGRYVFISQLSWCACILVGGVRGHVFLLGFGFFVLGRRTRGFLS